MKDRNRYKRLTPEQKVRIIELFHQGVEIKYIAERFDMTYDPVWKIIQKEKKDD